MAGDKKLYQDLEEMWDTLDTIEGIDAEIDAVLASTTLPAPQKAQLDDLRKQRADAIVMLPSRPTKD